VILTKNKTKRKYPYPSSPVHALPVTHPANLIPNGNYCDEQSTWKLIPAVSMSDRNRAVASNKILKLVCFLTIGEEPIIIHARVVILGAAALVDIIFVTAIDATVVGNTALVWGFGGGIASFSVWVTVAIVVMIDGFVAKVIDVNFTDLTLGTWLIREIDDTVFDNVAVHAMHVVSFLPTMNYIVTIDVVYFEFPKIAGFD
jgi:hypothetical protein